MEKNKKNVTQTRTYKKNWNKILMATLLGLLALEITFIPLLIYAEVKRVLPIIAFLVIPTVFAIIILFLVRTCLREVKYRNKEVR